MTTRVLCVAVALLGGAACQSDRPPSPLPGTTASAARGSGQVSAAAVIERRYAAAAAARRRAKLGAAAARHAGADNLVVHAGHRNCTNDFAVCPARAGVLHYPFNMAIRDGVMYVHDHVLAMRRIELGAAPTISNFAYETGPMAFDDDGRLYVDRWDDNRQRRVIERVDPVTGERTTCAGDGESRDDGPARDAAIGGTDDVQWHDGKLFFSDQGETRRVRVLEGGCDGTVRTIVGAGPDGSGSPGFSGDGGPALDAQLEWVAGLAFDDAGNLYLADGGNGVIRKVVPDGDDYAAGTISTIAGTPGEHGFSGDGGPATEARIRYPRGILHVDGHLRIGDQGNARIRDIDLATGVISTIVGTGVLGTRGEGPAALIDLDGPAYMALDVDGSMYITDVGNERILRCDAAFQCHRVVGVGFDLPGPATSNTPGFGFGLVCSEKSGDCFRSDLWTSIFKISPEGQMSVHAGIRTEGELSGDGGPANQAALMFPNRLALDQQNGDLYIAGNFDASTIRKVDGKTGIITTIAGTGERGLPSDGEPAISQPFPDIFGMAVHRGVLYVAIFQFGPDYLDFNKIIKIEDGIVHTVAGNGAYGFCGDGAMATETCLAWASTVTIHPKTGEVYFSEEDAELVRKVDAETGRIVTVAGDGFQVPGGIDGRFTGDGGPAIAASFWFPRAFFDPEGNLVIADLLNFVIREVVPVRRDGQWNYRDGIITTIAGAAPSAHAVPGDGGPAFGVPVGVVEAVAFDGAHNLFATTWDNDFFRFPSAHEDVVWRLGGAMTVAAAGPLSPATQLVELALDYGTGAPRGTRYEVTAQLIDPYGLRGRKIAALRVAGAAGGEQATFDLRADAQRLAAEGVVASKIRVETRSGAGRWITGDLAVVSPPSGSRASRGAP